MMLLEESFFLLLAQNWKQRNYLDERKGKHFALLFTSVSDSSVRLCIKVLIDSFSHSIFNYFSHFSAS